MSIDKLIKETADLIEQVEGEIELSKALREELDIQIRALQLLPQTHIAEFIDGSRRVIEKLFEDIINIQL